MRNIEAKRRTMKTLRQSFTVVSNHNLPGILHGQKYPIQEMQPDCQAQR